MERGKNNLPLPVGFVRQHFLENLEKAVPNSFRRRTGSGFAPPCGGSRCGFIRSERDR